MRRHLPRMADWWGDGVTQRAFSWVGLTGGCAGASPFRCPATRRRSAHDTDLLSTRQTRAPRIAGFRLTEPRWPPYRLMAGGRGEPDGDLTRYGGPYGCGGSTRIRLPGGAIGGDRGVRIELERIAHVDDACWAECGLGAVGAVRVDRYLGRACRRGRQGRWLSGRRRPARSAGRGGRSCVPLPAAREYALRRLHRPGADAGAGRPGQGLLGSRHAPLIEVRPSAFSGEDSTLIGAGIWHSTGVAPQAADVVAAPGHGPCPAHVYGDARWVAVTAELGCARREEGRAFRKRTLTCGNETS